MTFTQQNAAANRYQLLAKARKEAIASLEEAITALKASSHYAKLPDEHVNESMGYTVATDHAQAALAQLAVLSNNC